MKLRLKKFKRIIKEANSRPAFHFQVEWDGLTMEFQEVTGLVKKLDPEIINGGNPAQKQRTPSSGYTMMLKRGVVSSNSDFSALNRKEQPGIKEREDMVIRLLDEQRHQVATWRVTAVRPTKVQASDLKADGNEVAIETIELTHEGLSLVEE